MMLPVEKPNCLCLTKNIQFPQAKFLLRRQCSDLSFATIMWPLIVHF